MKGLTHKLLLALACSSLHAIKSDPWIPPLFELNAGASYSFSWFPDVDNAVNPSSYHSHINQLNFNVNGSFTPQLFVELDLNFNETRKVNFGFESIAPCIKYQLFNDLTGDPVAFLIGASFRYVLDDRVRDVAVPYGGAYNFDFLMSIGKEFDKNGNIEGRVFGLFDIGVAAQGMPWIYVDIAGEAVFYENNWLIVGVDGYYGFGTTTQVNINKHYGWGSIQHNSMDVKLGYTYKFDVWGELAFEYKRRVVAVSYPEELNLFGVSYNVSFSF
ncbi:hypothetical protein K0U07_00735 [bacterium]|nr:hypothetical protein [bacterium]